MIQNTSELEIILRKYVSAGSFSKAKDEVKEFLIQTSKDMQFHIDKDPERILIIDAEALRKFVSRL